MSLIVEDAKKAEEAKNKGNALFRAEKYEEAIEAYTVAVDVCPEEDKRNRAVYHCNRAAVFLTIGEVDSAVDDCSAAIDLDPDYRRAYLRRARANLQWKDKPRYEDALADLQHLKSLDPPDEEAIRMLPEVEKKAEVERERLKDEMMGQLKDLGNTVLGWAGLSLDNFKAEKDPSTGQYSVQFVQKQ